MLRFLKNWSLQRSGWLLLFVSAIGLECAALYFQYGLELQPCVMCIYERVAVLGIAFTGVVGLIAPSYFVVRLMALGLGLWSSIKGLFIALEHFDLQMHPAPWKNCPFIPDFPVTLPLHQWFPAIFKPTGSCLTISWEWLSLTMVQWLIITFSLYILVLVLVLLSQFKKHRTRTRDIFR